MRCYNGCPNDELKAHLEAIAQERTRLAERFPGARCTYFPNGEFYLCFDANHFALGKECKSVSEAVSSALGEIKT